MLIFNNLYRKILISLIVLVAIVFILQIKVEAKSYYIEDMDILNSARGTDDEFIFEGQIPNSLIDKPLPQSLNMGAKLIVVSACKEDERNYEYKTASGKMYGSLSYCISELLKVNVDFNKWVEYFQDEQYRKQKIFQLSQHPSIVIYD